MKKVFFILCLTLFVCCSRGYKITATQPETQQSFSTEEMVTEDVPEDKPDPEQEGGKTQTGVEIKDGEVNETGRAVVKKNNGYLTIIAHVNAEITDTVYVQFFNTKTYVEYAYYLYSVNDYKTNIELPAGNYIIMDGGLPADTKGLYPIEEKQFVIEPAQATLVEFGIGMEPNQLGVYGDEYETIEIAQEPSMSASSDSFNPSYTELKTNSSNGEQIEPAEVQEREEQSYFAGEMKKLLLKLILSFSVMIVIAIIIIKKRK